MIEPGTYRARATGGDVGFTEGGKEQAVVVFELLDAPGTFISAYLYFTEKTTERSLESLRICGWDTDDVTDLHGIDANEVSIVVEHDEYNGKTSAKVKWINRPGGGVAIKHAMLAASKAAFSQRMKAAAIVSRAKAPAPSATPAQPKRATPPRGEEDDPLPF